MGRGRGGKKAPLACEGKWGQSKTKQLYFTARFRFHIASEPSPAAVGAMLIGSGAGVNGSGVPSA